MAKIKFDFKKIDFTKVKQFLLAKGEKVALGSVAGIGALLVLLGLWGAMSVDGKQKTQELRLNTGKIRTLISADTVAKIKEVDIKTNWSSRFFNFPFLQMVLISEGLPPKRQRPEVKPVLVSDDGVQFDFWSSAPIQIYSIDPDTQKAEVVATKTSKELVETIAPKSLLVVTAFFPMAEQIQEFRKALRIAREDDLGKDYPQILGICVRRVELTKKPNPETNETEWVEVPGKDVDLYRVEKDTIVAADHLKDLLRKAHIDDDALAPFEMHRMPNLMTLMPKLSSTDYKPLKLKNYRNPDAVKKGDKSKDGKLTKGQKGFEAPGANKKPVRHGDVGTAGWDELAAVDPNPGFDGGVQKGGNAADASRLNTLIARFRGTYPFFDGQEAGKEDANKGFDGNKGFDKQRGGKQFDNQNKGNVPFKGEPTNDPLVRFFDVDLEPGHTYAYQIAVRIKNPNHNMGKEVTRPEDADDPELTLNWAVTKPFTVPEKTGDVQIYAVDRWQKKPPVHPLGPDTAVLDEKTNRAPVQIHCWFDEGRYGDDRFIIVDWVVAERVLVRRGEYIGRKDLMVLAPSWSKLKGDFEIINPPKSAAGEEREKEPEKGGNKILGAEQPKEKKIEDKGKDKEKPFQAPPPSGINLDFTVTKALLLDFDGGPKGKSGGGFNVKVNIEESAMDLLILNPDGKMVVRNTHRDYNNPVRIEREREYNERIKAFMSAPTDQPDNNKKGPARDKILN